MTCSARNDVIVAAIVISAILHIGAMLWAKPRIMTHVVSGVTQFVQRGPLRVKNAAVRPDPVSVERVSDVSPAREAPTPELTDVDLPGAVGFGAAERNDAAASMPVQMPEVISRTEVEAKAPSMEYAVAQEVVSETPKMALEAPTMPIGVSEPMIGRQIADLPSTPSFAAPHLTPSVTSGEGREKVRMDRPEDESKPEFKSVSEVMSTVDERVVEAEKAAVRDLLDEADALDLCSVVTVSLDACQKGGYTYFRATVRPKARLPAVPKDLVVMIDASGSIGGDRLASCRKAARELLRTATNTGDRFNLVAFRDRFEYAFNTWRPCDADSFAAGDRWLSRQTAHGRTDVFDSIASVLTLPREPTRPLVALVVTDGVANEGVSDTAQILSKFTALNDGLVSVYMYGVKQAANRELINVLTHGNRGEGSIYDGWRRHAGDGIGTFSERFRDPLVTDLRLVYPTTCPAESYPVLLKNLCRGNTVEIVGRVAGSPLEIAFSLRGLAGANAYEGFFRLPMSSARQDSELPVVWNTERALDQRLR